MPEVKELEAEYSKLGPKRKSEEDGYCLSKQIGTLDLLLVRINKQVIPQSNDVLIDDIQFEIDRLQYIVNDMRFPDIETLDEIERLKVLKSQLENYKPEKTK